MSTYRGKGNERLLNGKLAELFCEYFDLKAAAERSSVIEGNKRLTPDIIVEAHGNAVVVETEYEPAAKIEEDVDRIIGKTVSGMGMPVSVIGVILPSKLKQYDGNELKDNLECEKEFRYYVKDGSGERFPKNGYLEGSLYNLIATITLTTIPQDKICKCVETMQEKIKRISYKLSEVDDTVKLNICKCLRQEQSEQTWRMAGLVLLNAGIFYEELALHRNEVIPFHQLKNTIILTPERVIEAWESILTIDYAPIFTNAVEILQTLPAQVAADCIEIIQSAIQIVAALKVQKSGDVYGSLYQTMLADRKKIASFYTRPQAAALLTELSLKSDDNPLWKNVEDVKKLRIADFTCGTGMLLTHAYHHIKHCLNGNIKDLHSHLLENCFYGYDIMPTATHLTVSNLAGMVPDAVFDMTNIYTVPIGIIDGGIYLGSLDLIKDNAKLTAAGTRQGGKDSKQVSIATIQHKTCDYILMNPPYARTTNHGGNRTSRAPPFAVFGIPDDDQITMADHNKKLFSGTCSDGNAGLATYFMAICHKKIKDGGTIGLILPSTMYSGSTWRKVRNILRQYYEDIMLVFVDRKNSGNNTYSSDTSMNEVIMIAKKRTTQLKSDGGGGAAVTRAKVAILDHFPLSRLEAIELAKIIKNTQPTKLEDSAGHTSIQLGDEFAGKLISCPIEEKIWWVSPSSNLELFVFAYNLIHDTSDDLPLVRADMILDVGKHHFDIIGTKKDGTPRGPFIKKLLQKNGKYNCLWNNNSKTQQTMMVEPDCTLEKKHDADKQHAENVWKTATHAHINQQVGYGSQRLIVAYTKNKTVGGRTWPNVIIDAKYEKAFTVWMNSVFGIITYWAMAGSQQPKRGLISRTSFKLFPMLDFSKLGDDQLRELDNLFDEISTKTLKPINQLDEDAERQKFDQGILKIFNLNVDLQKIYDELISAMNNE